MGYYIDTYEPMVAMKKISSNDSEISSNDSDKKKKKKRKEIEGAEGAEGREKVRKVAKAALDQKSPSSEKEKSSKKQESNLSENAPFVASKKFDGARPGYIFKKVSNSYTVEGLIAQYLSCLSRFNSLYSRTRRAWDTT